MPESVLVDQSRMNPRRASSLAVNDVADSGGGFMMRTRHTSLNSYSSFGGGGGAGTGFMSNGSSHHLQQQHKPPPPPPPSVYGSLASSFCNDQKLTLSYPHLPIHQPPLLPLPSANKPPVLVPSSPKLTRTNTGNGAFRSREHRAMKPKPSMNNVSRNAAAAVSQAREHPKAGEKLVIASGKDEEAELVEMESIYALSPPPSNLPLPTFLLTRHKAATAASCKDQVVMKGGDAAGGY